MSRVFTIQNGSLIYKRKYETLKIEGWGENALRVRATENRAFTKEDWALTESVPHEADVHIETRETANGGKETVAIVENGKIRAEMTESGRIRFLNDKGEVLLKEHYLAMGFGNDFGDIPDWINLHEIARKYRSVGGDNYKITVSFNADENEKIFGMGQYQQSNLNLKGCILELRQINTQASVPFYVSNKGYGFLMNNPAIGKAAFGNNHTEWQFESTKQIDYWITAGDTPADIERQYSACTGRAPMMPDYAMGFWQCKLRYQTQEELLEVARKYHALGIPVDIIVADFFHWTKMGEWKFDPQFWPDPEGMCKELSEMGIKLVVSVWPTVDMQSENMGEMTERDMLIRVNRGMNRQMECVNISQFADMTNPETREFVFGILKKNYLDKGVSQFWLDVAEPEFDTPDHDIYRYYKGQALEVANAYPADYAKMIYDGMRALGRDDVVSLIRCAWAGSQKYGALAWSGDVQSNFETFKRQVVAGLNMGMAGIPWWNADIGGFFMGDIRDEKFHELLMRWFAFAAFSPVMRLHGDRNPHDKPALVSSSGKECCASGADNEVWSYGEKVEKVLRKYIDLRYRIKPYTKRLMQEAHENGAPVMRPVFYNFPADKKAWDVNDAYMYGPDVLVAPIFEAGAIKRNVYLPEGANWIDMQSQKIYAGGQAVCADAPMDVIPVFVREGADVEMMIRG
ncbi:MAG: glycoside hydrolase family 31 protein [Clostridia bacterium]|nr:glycoside hydrolase family 31 protein [Clostridia bacterium]